jgi:dynein heavy chain
MYGGRVTDSIDRRVLNTYLHEYLGEFVFDDCQPFYFSRAGFDYTVPRASTIDEYRQSLESLPLEHSPRVFGLHDNADIRHNNNTAKQLWADLLLVQARAHTAAAATPREAAVAELAQSLLPALPRHIDASVVRRTCEQQALAQARAAENSNNSTTGGASAEPDVGAPGILLHPAQVVLLQELDRWNVLVDTMRSSLQELLLALSGRVGMSSALDSLADGLHRGTLPSLWRALAPQTEKPLSSWLAHLSQRQAQYERWAETCTLPPVVWLAGLHEPQALLTALVQATCRAQGWALDRATLATHITNVTDPSRVTTAPAQGCYVQGLVLEGAGWDHKRQCLAPQQPKVLVTKLPVVHFEPLQQAKARLTQSVRVPVYVTQARRNAMGTGLVTNVDLPTQTHHSHWVLQGAAVVLNTDE